MRRLILCIAVFLLVVSCAVAPLLFAQSGSKVIAIQGAKIYTLAGPPIANGTVVIRDGKIVAVGQGVAVPAGAQVIDAKGLEVYPGLFDSVTQLGLTEIGAVSATVDTNELGEYSPQLVAATAVHPASELIPVARANGITHANAVPGVGGGGGGFGGGGGGARVIGGQASAINLSGWTIEEMLIRQAPVAMVLTWPSLQAQGGGFGGGGGGQQQRRPFTEVKQEYDRRVNALAELLDTARHYQQAVEKGSAQNFERDLKLEALVPVVKGERPVLVIANDDRMIKAAVEFCEKQKIKMILGGAGGAWKVKDLLQQKNIPVVLGPTQTLPRNEDDPYDKPFTQPGELSSAGVKIAFATYSASNSRTLPYEAAQAVPFGLPREEALKAITIYPAQIFGLDKQVGTIEPGKLANLIVTTGDPLDIPSEVRYLFIRGQLASLDNKHKQLYETYRKRP